MDAIHLMLTVLGTATFIYVFSVVVGIKLERWKDDAGVERPKRRRRTSNTRNAAGMALGIYGTGVAILGGAWIALGAILVIGGLVGGIVVLVIALPARTVPERGPCLRSG